MNNSGKNRKERNPDRGKTGNNSSRVMHKLLETVVSKSKSRAWYIGLMAFAVAVVFITAYGLILPAITMEKNTAEKMSGIELESDVDRDEEQGGIRGKYYG